MLAKITYYKTWKNIKQYLHAVISNTMYNNDQYRVESKRTAI